MSTFRRGIVHTPSAPQTRDVAPHQVVGRPLTIRPSIITEPEPQPRNIRPTAVFHEPPIRGLLVDSAGKPLRGLSPATIKAHHDHTEAATELCTRCGEMRPPAQMRTVIQNAYNSNNPLRVCKVECLPQTYKDPSPGSTDKWQPSVPAVRFDRESGRAYDAKQAGVSMRDLVTKDTYHRERDVPSEYRAETLHNEGQWSGGGRAGHTITPETLARSRDAAARVRR